MGRKKGRILTFDEIFTKYIDYNMERKVKTDSYVASKGMYEYRIQKYIGHIPMDRLTKEVATFK